MYPVNQIKNQPDILKPWIDPLANVENKTDPFGDWLTDEQFEQAFQKQDEEDEVEKSTVAVFSTLFTISDGIGRDDIEGEELITDKKVEQAHVHHSENKHRYNSYQQKEVGFFDDENFEEPVDFSYIISHLGSIFGKIFIGGEYFYTAANQISLPEMKKLYADAAINWEPIRNKYKESFSQAIDEAFGKAETLVSEKESYRNTACFERVALYAQLIFAGVALKMDKREYKILALVTSSITFIGMLAHYAITSIEESKIAADLKCLVEIAYKNAAKSRL